MTEIYYARTDVSYSGGDKFFTITFSYIKKEHINVYINDEKTENFTFNTDSQIVVNDDLVVGDIVSIRRNTPIDNKSAAGQFVQILCNERVTSSVANSGENAACTVEMAKGDTATIYYSAQGDVKRFRFVYNKGNGALYFKLNNAVTNLDLMDAGAISTALNNKADKDLGNCTKPYITETYSNGTSWYRVYSDGWIEQGGHVSYPADVTFLKPFTNANYTVTLGQIDTQSGYEAVVAGSRTATTMHIYQLKNNYSGTMSWVAKGY